ncbi:MAG: lipoxygenase family protein, partial [Polyangiales bacterium]
MPISLPCRPSAAADPIARARQLDAMRASLRYAYDQPPGIAMAESVPKGHEYPPEVVLKVVELGLAMKLNRAAADLEGVTFKSLLHRTPAATSSSLRSCRALFATIGAPAIAAIAPTDPRADAAFAWQRVAGANPFLLRAIDRLPDNFRVTAADFTRAIGSADSLDAARAEGRLFLADWAALEGIPAGVGDGRNKHLAAPLALFVNRLGVGLRPVAIQCAQTPVAGAAPLTPDDGVAWQIARAIVQAADCNLQEIFFHLGRAHFLVEAFAVATLRQLAPQHPIATLLAPHFEGTLAINDAARTKLCVAGGQMETLLAPTREAALALSRSAIETFRFDDDRLPNELARRGVADASVLADYPFRDDARLIWDAIDAFARAYVALYYEDDAAVANDTELAAWVDEIRSNDGGRVRGFPERIDSRARLGDALGWLVFTTSAHHASVNYTQFDWMGYAPNMPASGYASAPVAGASLDADAAWAALLPSPSLAAEQVDFFYQ